MTNIETIFVNIWNHRYIEINYIIDASVVKLTETNFFVANLQNCYFKKETNYYISYLAVGR